MTTRKTYDYIIAGGGAAGCVVARRLIERSDASVLLLEAGPRYAPLILDTPLPSIRFGRLLYSWPLASLPQPGLGGRVVSYPMGRILGGSSSINAMMAVNGFDADFDAWAAAGNDGWSAADLRPYLARAFEGADAPLSVNAPSHRASFSEAFLDACVDAGLVRRDLLVDVVAGSCGYYGVMQRRGRRHASAAGYLAPVRSQARLDIATGAEVKRILFRAGRAIGIEYLRNGVLQTAHADSEVILAMGAFGSPHALLKSGVGPHAEIVEAGLPVVCDLPGVGRGLADHVRVPVLYRSGRPKPARYLDVPRAALELWRFGTGVLASNCCEAGAFLSSTNREVDLQLVLHFQTIDEPDAVDFECVNVRPHSRGSVRLDPRDPLGAPLIDPALLRDDRDLDPLLSGIHVVRDLVARAALQRFPLHEEILPGAARRSKADLVAHIRAHATTSFHPTGTCGMGVDESAVVDPRLRVHGLQGLRIVDASVFPLPLSGNTCNAVVTVAEKSVDLILGAGETTP